MNLNINNLVNESLIKLAKSLKVKTVELLSSTYFENEVYHLYEVDNILVIEYKDSIIVQWDEEFDNLYFKHFAQESSKK